jgi:uncharacterized protein GlcG (DUF336 family)
MIMKPPTRIVPRLALKSVLGFAVAVLLCAAANAQESATTPASANARTSSISHGVVTQRNLSLGLAKTIAEATLAACEEKGYHTAAAVVDRSGQILVLLRDERTTANVAEMARRKAYTARMFRSATADFQKRTAGDSPMAGQRNLPDILALSGGVPVKIGEEVIGAVGSAGSTLESDDACAKAGIDKVADQLK